MLINLSNNPLYSVVDNWWLMHQEKINGVANVTSKCIVEQVLASLLIFQKSDNYEEDAAKTPARFLLALAQLCNHTSLPDRQQCAAAICQVLSACATLIENHKLSHIQGELQIKIRDYQPAQELRNDFFSYMSDSDFVNLQSWLKTIWNQPIQLYSQFKDVPDICFMFFNLAKVKNVREEAEIICKGLQETIASYKDEKPEKGKVIEFVFGPYLQNKKISRMPEYSEFQKIFYDSIGGISDNGYRPIREDLNRKYHCDR